VYRLVATPEYEAELRLLGPEADITRELEGSVYQVLRQSPADGFESRSTGLRYLRRRIVMRLLLVQVAYRVDETARAVTLVSIREVDQTRL
jgi:hypothetical protein